MRRRPVSSDKRFRANRVRADHGPAERWRHSGRVLELTESAGVLAARATEEHPLDVLVVRRLITAAQREAALKFKRDYHAAGLASRVIGSYNPERTAFSPFGTWNERTDAEERAYQRWRKALAALGRMFGAMVTDTACHDLWPDPARTTQLAEGFELLVTYYRMPSDKFVHNAAAR